MHLRILRLAAHMIELVAHLLEDMEVVEHDAHMGKTFRDPAWIGETFLNPSLNITLHHIKSDQSGFASNSCQYAFVLVLENLFT